MSDMTPSRKSVNQIMIDPVILKRTTKAIEAAEPMNQRPILSDIHVSDAEDSHPNVASSLRKQTAEPEPPLNGD